MIKPWNFILDFTESYFIFYSYFLASQLLSALITLIDVLNIMINEINNSPIIKFIACFKFESCLTEKNE